jgi:microsomal dipeptidase-like Zn-dependent dipeptidase
MHRSPISATVFVAGALLITAVPSLGSARVAESTGPVQQWLAQPRAQVPEDRYALAGGCYAIRSGAGDYVVREGTKYTASGASISDAEAFHFQATDLGRYLLFDSEEDFLAATEGVLGEAAYAVTRSTPGGIAGGAAGERTDKAADDLARSEANSASGRGTSVVAAARPSDLADWKIDDAGPGEFSVVLPETDQALATDASGALVLGPADGGSAFAFELTDGCASFPEIEVNVDGPVLGGENSFQEVRGFLEAHSHMMAFEFIGGRVRCGRPWHRFGVDHALVDCPDHEPGGIGAALEQVLSGPGPHNTDGWPTFAGWPRPGSLTHEQVYYKWLERAWRGGLRLMVNLLVDNGQLCKTYPFKRNSCNEMDGVRLQAQRIRELERYIDAQSGGPGEGWFRIVEDPFKAREVINSGKLAVVLGMEVSVPLDCGLSNGEPTCNEQEVVERLQALYDLGVRQMELVNKFDNAFSGVTGDSGETGVVVNTGNRSETGRFWQLETCGEQEHAHDKHQHNFHDQSGAPDELSGRDSIFGGVLKVTGRSGAAPLYPEGPHCNVLGLSDLGKRVIAEMAQRGMIFDPDHMSARARTQSLDFIQNELDKVNGLPYSGIVSSHGWADDTIYPRVYELGGVVTPHAGGSTGFVEKWEKHRAWADPRYYFGIGFGSDVNGFSAQGGPRGTNAPNKVTYPFTGFGGVMVNQQVSGERTYDINAHGVAHYGLYPDWIEDLRRQAGDEIIEDLVRGAEAYLQMWERALGIAPDACRSDVEDLTRADMKGLKKGMSPEQVLANLGQPSGRTGTTFVYCVSGGTQTLTFTSEGSLTSWKSKRPVRNRAGR